MRKATKQDIASITAYLKQDIANCIYIYIDTGTYGIDNPNMEVWIDGEPDQLKMVAMRYYNSLQLFAADDDWDKESIIALIRKNRFPVINGRLAMLDAILPEIPGYTIHRGEVYQYNKPIEKQTAIQIEKAGDRDYREIALLTCMDENFAHYDPLSLEKQMRERAETGMGRSLVIRENGKIVGHIATYAEFENLAVTSGLIVHPDYEGKAIGFLLENALVKELQSEGKTVFSFVSSRGRKALLRAMGCTLVADYGKMVPAKEPIQ